MSGSDLAGAVTLEVMGEQGVDTSLDISVALGIYTLLVNLLYLILLEQQQCYQVLGEGRTTVGNRFAYLCPGL